MTAQVLAVDIGGTKLAAGIVDASGTVLIAARRPTPVTSDAEELWDAITGLVGPLMAGRPVVGVGIGCGGPMRWPAGEVSPLSIPAWREFPVRARARSAWPGLPVRLHNDAPCLAAAEHWLGAGRDCAAMLGMVVSTGVGGGIVLGGRLVDGATGNAGHIGHVVVEPDGPECACGGRGCLEAIASGPSMVRLARADGWVGATARDLAADALSGDCVAAAMFARAGGAVGLALASTVHLCDLELVAIGGGVAQVGALLFDPIEVAFHKHARLEFTRATRIVPAALGAEAGIVGAAALVLGGDRYWSAGD